MASLPRIERKLKAVYPASTVNEGYRYVKRKVIQRYTGRPWRDAGGGKAGLMMTVKQSAVSDSFMMRVPIDVYVNGQPRRLGLVNVKGSSTANGKTVLPFRPQRVVLDDSHSILCTVRQ